MAYETEEEVEEEVAEGEQAEGEEGGGDQPFLYSITGQTPWWIVSILLHALVIVLAGLMTVSIDLGPDKKPFTGVGLAVMQAPRNGALAGRTYVIVLYGKAR